MRVSLQEMRLPDVGWDGVTNECSGCDAVLLEDARDQSGLDGEGKL